MSIQTQTARCLPSKTASLLQTESHFFVFTQKILFSKCLPSLGALQSQASLHQTILYGCNQVYCEIPQFCLLLQRSLQGKAFETWQPQTKKQTIAIVTQLVDKICSRVNLDFLTSIIWINLMCLSNAGETPMQLYCPSHGQYKWIKVVFSFLHYKTLGYVGQCMVEHDSGMVFFPEEGTTGEIWFLRCPSTCRTGGVRVPERQGSAGAPVWPVGGLEQLHSPQGTKETPQSSSSRAN